MGGQTDGSPSRSPIVRNFNEARLFRWRGSHRYAAGEVLAERRGRTRNPAVTGQRRTTGAGPRSGTLTTVNQPHLVNHFDSIFQLNNIPRKSNDPYGSRRRQGVARADGLPFNDGGAPGQASAEDNEQHQVAPLDMAGLHGFVQMRWPPMPPRCFRICEG